MIDRNQENDAFLRVFLSQLHIDEEHTISVGYNGRKHYLILVIDGVDFMWESPSNSKPIPQKLVEDFMKCTQIKIGTITCDDAEQFVRSDIFREWADARGILLRSTAGHQQTIQDRVDGSIRITKELQRVLEGSCGSTVLNRLLQVHPWAAKLHDHRRRMPLHLAVTGRTKSSDAIVDALLGAFPEAAKHTDENGMFPLHCALQGTPTTPSVILKLLAVCPDAAKHTLSNGRLPLHLALKGRRAPMEVVEALLQAYPEAVSMQDWEGKTPLHFSVEGISAGSELVSALLRADAGAAALKDRYGGTAMCRAVAGIPASREVVSALRFVANDDYLEEEACLKHWREEDWSLYRGESGQERRVYQYRASRGTTLLHHALMGTPAGIDIVQDMMGCDNNAPFYWQGPLSALHFAVANKTASIEVVEELFDYQFRPEEGDYNAGKALIGETHWIQNELQRVFTHSTSLYSFSGEYVPLLHCALEGSHPAGIEVVRALLKFNPAEARQVCEFEWGLEVSAAAAAAAAASAHTAKPPPPSYPPEQKQCTEKVKNISALSAALQGACASIEVVRHLLDLAQSADDPWKYSAPDSAGMLPLHWALQGTPASIDIIRLLLEHHPEAVDHRDERGRTPMHWAMEETPASCAVVEELLLHGKWLVFENRESEPAGEDVYDWYVMTGNEVERDEDKDEDEYDEKTRIDRYYMEECSKDRRSKSMMLRDKRGRTPLHLAMQGTRASLETVKALIEADDLMPKCQAFDLDMPPLAYNWRYPLHFALTGKAPTACDCAVVEALFEAFPAAANEVVIYGDSGNLIEIALNTGFPSSVVFQLVKACKYQGRASDDLIFLFKRANDRERYPCLPSWYKTLFEPRFFPAFVGPGKEYRSSSVGGVNQGIPPSLRSTLQNPESRDKMVDALVQDTQASEEDTFHSWIGLVSSDDNCDIVTAVLQHPDANVWHLLHEYLDLSGRKAIDIATPQCKKKMGCASLLCGRYEFVHTAPSYVSDTCEVWFATCTEPLTSHDESRNVCIKLLHNEIEFRREQESRKTFDLDTQFVVAVMDSLSLNGQQSRLPEASRFKHSSTAGFCIVMEGGVLNFGEMLKNQRLAGDYSRVVAPLTDIARFLEHLHEQGLVHCDVKPQNVVQIGGRIKGIDFDGCAEADKGFFGSKVSTAYLPPECVIENADGKFRAAAQQDEVPATPSIDVWQFGVLMYHAMAGQELFQTDVRDNLARERDWLELAQWTERSKKQRLRLVKHDRARELLEKLLMKDPTCRPETMTDVLDSAFFRPESYGLQRLEARVEEILSHTAEIRTHALELKDMTLKVANMASRTLDQVKRSEGVLRRAVFEASEVSIPTCFVILPHKVSSRGSVKHDDKVEMLRQHMRGISAVGKAMGCTQLQLVGDLTFDEPESCETELNLTDKCENNNNPDQQEGSAGDVLEPVGLVGQLMSGAVGGRIEAWLSSKLYDPDRSMFLYLIDECTGHPVWEEEDSVYPIQIKAPRESIQKLLPLMYLSISAVTLANGAAGLARMFGFPCPIVPSSLRSKARKLAAELGQEHSAQEFACLQSCVADAKDKKLEGGGEKLGGAALREFARLLEVSSPRRFLDPSIALGWTVKFKPEGLISPFDFIFQGLESDLKEDGDKTFGGLQRVMAEDGTVFWTSKHNARLMQDGLFISSSHVGDEEEQVSSKVRELEERLQAAEDVAADLRNSLRRQATMCGVEREMSPQKSPAQSVEFSVIKLGRGLSSKLRRKLVVVGSQGSGTARLLNLDCNGRTKKEFGISQLAGLARLRAGAEDATLEFGTSDLRITFNPASKQKDYEVQFESGKQRAIFCALLLSHSASIACDQTLSSAAGTD